MPESSQIRPPRPLPRRQQLRIVAGSALAVVGVIALVQLLPWLFGPGATSPEAPPPPGTFRPTDAQWSSLVVAPIKAMRFQKAMETDGKIAIDDDRNTPVFSPYSGRVTKLFAKAGDTVAQGAPLFAIESTEFAQAQNDLISAVAGLATAGKQLDLAQTNEKRQEGLYAAKGGALKDLQQSRVDLATAQGGFRTAQVALGAVRNRLHILGKSDAEVDDMEKSADADKFEAEAIVRAPIAGTVTQRQISLGQNIVGALAASGSASPVFVIGDITKVWLLASVREADAPSVRVGNPVEARILAYPDRIFRGTLSYVAAGIDPTSHRLLVHAEIDNLDRALKPEMFADFRIIIGNDEEQPAVPEESIIYEGTEARVWVALKDKSVGLREIRTGSTEDGMVEVLAGVSAGESVVTSGSLFIDRAAHSD